MRALILFASFLLGLLAGTVLLEPQGGGPQVVEDRGEAPVDR